MNILDMEMHDRLDLLGPLDPILHQLAGLGHAIEKLAACLNNIHPPVIDPTPWVAHPTPWVAHPTPGQVTPRPPHLPPAPVDAPLALLARTQTPAPPGPWALAAQQRQHILDELRRADAVAWLPNGGYRRHGRAARSRRRTR